MSLASRAVRRLQTAGFTQVQAYRRGAWAVSDPVAALAAVLPGLVHARPVATYDLLGRLHLAYAVGEQILVGGPPDPQAAISEEWDVLSWEVPRPLARLYALHDGFGPVDGPRAHWWRDAILPAGDLFPLTRLMRFGEENILYRPGDLLLFCPDGRGGGQCVERNDALAPDPPTRAWDPGTRQLGSPIRLSAFLAALVERWTGRPRSSC